MSPSIKYQLITNEDQQEESQHIFDKGLKIIITCVLLFILLLYKYPLDVSINIELVQNNVDENVTDIHVKGIQEPYGISTTTKIGTIENTIINEVKSLKYSNFSTTEIAELQTTQSSIINQIQISTKYDRSTMQIQTTQSSVIVSNIETSTKSVSATTTKTSLDIQMTQSSTINEIQKSTKSENMMMTTSKDIAQPTQSFVLRTLKANTEYPNPDNNKTFVKTTESFNNVSKSTQNFQMIIANTSEVMQNITVKPPTAAASVPKKYYVYTSTCQMPFIDRHQKDVMKIYRPKPFKNCTKDKDLVSSSFDNVKRRYTLHINGNPDDIHCCYQNIIRAGLGNSADKTFKALPCVNFHQDFVVPEHIDALIVTCNHKRSAKLTQLSGFSFIQKKNSTAGAEVKNSTQSNSRYPNILMVGIDSLSRMNFWRTMPLTHQYLSDNKWFELEGYNKMGDNTFPNLMALLTGYNNERAYHDCNPKVAGGLDKCTYLWNNYKKNGYHTAYAEDWAQFATFNYLKKGFQKQPTDYYMRPLTLAMERLLKVHKQSSIPYCVGQKHYAEYIYDNAMQFSNFYRDEKYFGFFWANSFSHNDFSLPSSMDSRMIKYFQEMESSGVFENTIVVFFSDHGMRFGELRKLQNGFLEERWPMFYISLPKWFQNNHSDFVKALRINRNRLSSPYDIHITMNHILKLSQPDYEYSQPQGCPKCQSIFYEIPENRTCDDAGISEHWCSCSTYTDVSIKDRQVLDVSKLIIDKINQYLAAKKFDSKCSKLKLGTVKNAAQKLGYKNALDLSYRLKLEAQPKSALFEATVKYDPNKKNITLDVELVSRLNTYEKVSHCIDDKAAKKYCICA